MVDKKIAKLFGYVPLMNKLMHATSKVSKILPVIWHYSETLIILFILYELKGL